MTDLSIRDAREEDLERITWLEQAAFADPWRLDLLTYEITHPGTLLLVAVRADEPAAGYAVFRHGGGEAELLRLAVDPGERRRGVARRLVEAGLDRLRREDVEACHLEVRTDNEGAIALYQALGFEPTGRRRGYYRDGADALVFSIPTLRGRIKE